MIVGAIAVAMSMQVLASCTSDAPTSEQGQSASPTGPAASPRGRSCPDCRRPRRSSRQA